MLVMLVLKARPQTLHTHTHCLDRQKEANHPNHFDAAPKKEAQAAYVCGARSLGLRRDL